VKVKEIASSAIGDTADVDFALACKWVSDRFIELSLTVRAIPFRREKQFTIPINITTGTATATNGSNKVTGNAAAQAVWDSSLVGRFFRIAGDNGWYQIINVTTELTLATTYAGTTVSAGTYTIVPRVITLDKGIRSIHGATNNRIGVPIRRMSQGEMDMRFPNRTDVAGGPLIYSEVGLDADNRHLVEFYPYTTDTVLVTYLAYIDPEPLTPEQDVPPFIPSYIIIEGVKLNIYESLLGQLIKDSERNPQANITVITSNITAISNLMARQKTLWKGVKADFKNVSGITEESKAVVQSYGRFDRGIRDIMTAEEHVISGWTPLV